MGLSVNGCLEHGETSSISFRVSLVVYWWLLSGEDSSSAPSSPTPHRSVGSATQH
uniref:Uncharacterized protein n=2 Tax=Picea TaxID=3328 RepID=A0A124GMZ8_PICGL|nr:hypothetical protein ABT39_MTgene5443 [Picea glauca]QHR91503.1 hypothetical protein Q903MT_gene5538 [Picea sitchensis]